MRRAALLAILLVAGCRDAAPAATALQLAVSRDHLRAGDDVLATVTAVDAQGRRVRDFRGALLLTVDAPADLPSGLAFDAAAAGQMQAHVRFRGAGTRHLGADASGLGASTVVQVDVSDPVVVDAVSGDGQQAQVGAPLASPLVVVVRDAFQNPVPGATVIFSGPTGATLEPAQALTGSDGRASTHVTLGTVAGTQEFQARAGGGVATLHALAFSQDAAALVLVSGDAQVGTAGQALAQPLVVRAIDASGNAVPGAAITWRASRGAAISPTHVASGSDGTVSATAVLPAGAVNASYVAQLGAASITFHAAPSGLSYGDPPADQGALRLEYAGPGAAPGSLQVKLVAAQELSGFAVGYDLPLPKSSVAVTEFHAGAALPPGTNPVAAKALIADSGPLAGMLVAAQSQKRAGQGAVPTDSTIPAGSELFTVTLAPVAGAAPGTLVDGQDPHFQMAAGLLRLSGTEVVGASGFAVGRLELH